MSFIKDKQDQKGSIDKEKKITKRTSRRHESKLLAFSITNPSNEEVNDDIGELSISPNTTLDQNTYEYPLRPLVISLLAIWPITWGVLVGTLTVLALVANVYRGDSPAGLFLCGLNSMLLVFGFYVAVNECLAKANDMHNGTPSPQESAPSPEETGPKINMNAYSVEDGETSGEAADTEQNILGMSKTSEANKDVAIDNSIILATTCMIVAFVGLFCSGFMLQGFSATAIPVFGSSTSIYMKGASFILIVASVSCARY